MEDGNINLNSIKDENEGNLNKTEFKSEGDNNLTNEDKLMNDDDYCYDDRLNVPFLEKKKGDDELKSKNFEEALKHYSKALVAIKILSDENALDKDELQKYVKEVGIPSNLNMSMAHMKQKDFTGAMKNLNHILNFDQSHVKARYRRCICLINLNEMNKAEDDLNFLKTVIESSDEFKELVLIYEDKKKNILNENKKVYKNMFKDYVKSKIIFLFSS